jgi:hypothetical protein
VDVNGKKVAELGIGTLFVKIRAKTGSPAPGPGAHAIIKSLSREGFKILSISDSTRVPRGGPKKKGGRRGRRSLKIKFLCVFVPLWLKFNGESRFHLDINNLTSRISNWSDEVCGVNLIINTNRLTPGLYFFWKCDKYSNPVIETIPLIKEGHDLIGQSKTGSGKTAAFGIPLVEKVKKAVEEYADKLRAVSDVKVYLK